MLKCKNCGGALVLQGDSYVCDYCGSSYFREELMPRTMLDPNFVMVGKAIVAYRGNDSTVKIPFGVVSIEKDAFKNNLSIRKVVFAPSVVSIGDSAFEGCSNLLEIENYANVSSFGNECFKYSGLLEVSILSNVQSIGKYSFSRMPNLQKVNYSPKKVLKLNHTFWHCPKLETVTYDEQYFFPSQHVTMELLNNEKNVRPTLGDAFTGTPFLSTALSTISKSCQNGVCAECGGSLKKGLFHIKCTECGIDFKN